MYRGTNIYFKNVDSLISYKKWHLWMNCVHSEQDFAITNIDTYKSEALAKLSFRRNNIVAHVHNAESLVIFFSSRSLLPKWLFYYWFSVYIMISLHVIISLTITNKSPQESDKIISTSQENVLLGMWHNFFTTVWLIVYLALAQLKIFAGSDSD